MSLQCVEDESSLIHLLLQLDYQQRYSRYSNQTTISTKMATGNEKLCMAMINNSTITNVDWEGVARELGKSQLDHSTYPTHEKIPFLKLHH